MDVRDNLGIVRKESGATPTLWRAHLVLHTKEKLGVTLVRLSDRVDELKEELGG